VTSRQSGWGPAPNPWNPTARPGSSRHRAAPHVDRHQRCDQPSVPQPLGALTLGKCGRPTNDARLASPFGRRST